VVQQVRGCTQWVFGAQAPASRVRPLVPRSWVFSRDALGTAVLSYRMFRCQQLRVDRVVLRDVTWSELGVRLLPPDGAPEIHVDTHVDGHDYYMLFLHTPSKPLARRLAAIGVPASVVPDMRYDERRTADGAEVHSVEGRAGRQYRVHVATGPVTSPVHQDVGVRSWHQGPLGITRGEENKPCVQGTLTDAQLDVDRGTLLAQLLDGEAQPDGSERLTSSLDPWLAFDSTTTFGVVGDVKEPGASPLHGVSLPCLPPS
jgi:hypothetical protein